MYDKELALEILRQVYGVALFDFIVMTGRIPIFLPMKLIVYFIMKTMEKITLLLLRSKTEMIYTVIRNHSLLQKKVHGS